MPKFKIKYTDTYEVVLEAETEQDAADMVYSDEDILRHKTLCTSEVLEIEEIK